MKFLAALTLVAGIAYLNPGVAQDRRPDAPPVKPQRTHYTVRHADPIVLAEVVAAHFKGEATVIAAPTGSGHALLISGNPAAVPEVVKLLEQLDKKPRTVEVEITVAELPVKKDGKELTAVEIATAEALVKDGKGQRIKLIAVEGREVTTQIGGNKPIVSSSVVGGPFGKGGGNPVTQRSINYQAVGVTVKMTSRIGADNAVALELSVQESKVRQPEASDEVGAASTENNSLNTKLNIPAGRSVVAQSVRSETKAGAVVSAIIVTAKVVDDHPTTSGH